MSVTVEDFVAYIGGDETDEANLKLALCFSVAKEKVTQHVMSTITDPEAVDPLATSSIPTHILDLAVIKVADELWNQRNIRPNPREQFDFGSGLVSNTSRDPMLAAYPLLNGWVLPW